MRVLQGKTGNGMKLAEKQQTAVEILDHNLQITACAGSGKTEAVAQRVVNLLNPQPGGAFTVKLYSSKKMQGNGGTWRHDSVTLSPLTSDYKPSY